MGVVDETVSFGGTGHQCAEGYAALSGNQSWVRLAAGTSSFPSISGSVMVMETAHTMGVVPAATVDGRQDAFSPGHSKNTAADRLTSTGRTTSQHARSSPTTGPRDEDRSHRLERHKTVLEPGD